MCLTWEDEMEVDFFLFSLTRPIKGWHFGKSYFLDGVSPPLKREREIKVVCHFGPERVVGLPGWYRSLLKSVESLSHCR